VCLFGQINEKNNGQKGGFDNWLPQINLILRYPIVYVGTTGGIYGYIG